MIKASDALDITVEKAAELIERDITDIEAAVYTAANKGSAHCIYYRLMSRQTQDYLKAARIYGEGLFKPEGRTGLPDPVGREGMNGIAMQRMR